MRLLLIAMMALSCQPVNNTGVTSNTIDSIMSLVDTSTLKPGEIRIIEQRGDTIIGEWGGFKIN